MKNNLRVLNQSLRQRIEHDMVLTRMGELGRRNMETMLGSMFIDFGATAKAYVFKGFVAAPGAALDVDLAVPAEAVHDIDGDNIRIAIDSNGGTAYNVALAAADPANPRIDIITARVAQRNVFTDASASIADPATKTVSPQSVERDIEYYFELQKVDGIPAGAPVPPAIPGGTAGSITGVPVITTVDLSLEYILCFAIGEDSEFIEVDCRGAIPSATTIAEVINAINLAGFGAVASNDGGDHLVITAPGTGETSVVKIKQPANTDLDCYNNILGGLEYVQYVDIFKGGNAWFKVCEIYVPALAVTLTAGNVRSIEEKDTDWDADNDKVVYSPGGIVTGSLKSFSEDAEPGFTAVNSQASTTAAGFDAIKSRNHGPVNAGDFLGGLRAYGLNSVGEKEYFGAIYIKANDPTDGAEKGDIEFWTRDAAGGSPWANRMTIAYNGDITYYGTTIFGGNVQINGNTGMGVAPGTARLHTFRNDANASIYAENTGAGYALQAQSNTGAAIYANSTAGYALETATGNVYFANSLGVGGAPGAHRIYALINSANHAVYGYQQGGGYAIRGHASAAGGGGSFTSTSGIGLYAEAGNGQMAIRGHNVGNAWGGYFSTTSGYALGSGNHFYLSAGAMYHAGNAVMGYQITGSAPVYLRDLFIFVPPGWGSNIAGVGNLLGVCAHRQTDANPYGGMQLAYWAGNIGIRHDGIDFLTGHSWQVYYFSSAP